MGNSGSSEGTQCCRAPTLKVQSINDAPGLAEATDATAGPDSQLKAAGDGYEESTRVYVDGSTYTGQMRNGLRDGQGAWLAPAVQYEGQWRGDLQEGQGELSWADGRAYCGAFSQGKFHGQGRMVWNTPKGLLIYEGQYVEDAKHGSGKFEWPDGGVYDGEWLQGKMWGMGWYTEPNGERRQGEWVEDRIQRWIDDPATEDTTQKNTI